MSTRQEPFMKKILTVKLVFLILLANPLLSFAEEPLEISDIRIVSLDSQSIKIFWQTNKPANSNLTISFDSAGKKIATTIIDTTFEQYHALATGDILAPQTNYFAIITSALPSGISTTQTLNFTTSKEEPADIVNQTASSAPSAINFSLPEPDVEISKGTNPGEISLKIEWFAPSYGESTEGYEIQIINAQDKIVNRLNLPFKTRTAEFRDLPLSEYRILIYGIQDGVFEKIAKPIAISIPQKFLPFYKTPLFYWSIIFIAFLWLIAKRSIKLKQG